jgi:hypothetical protein
VAHKGLELMRKNNNDKEKIIYQIDITDTTDFKGYRTETIYGYAHAVSDQLLTISAVNGGRRHYNWSLVQSFRCSPLEVNNA